ncbi:hypothetical protein GY631_6402 [Trichophyton interdigitale]|nr:hypothetical protein GY631_6402 [Trichophyton interdigitale]KAG5217937.1 hypothetical protein GY632_6049 [Trichophyton interdigitale]
MIIDYSISQVSLYLRLILVLSTLQIVCEVGTMGTMPWRQVSAERKEKKGLDEPPAYRHGVDEVSVPEKISTDNTHRNLKPRHIQLIGIGGTIGTALFVQIGRGLLSGGPANIERDMETDTASPSVLGAIPRTEHQE